MRITKKPFIAYMYLLILVIYLRNAARPPGKGNSPPILKGAGVIGDPDWNDGRFADKTDAGVAKFPFVAPEDATAAIKEGKVCMAPAEAVTEECPKIEAAAATAEGLDIALEATPVKVSLANDGFGVCVRYKLEKVCLFGEVLTSWARNAE